MYNIVFKIEQDKEITVTAEHGTNLLEAAQKANVYIDAPCSGNGTCGKCKVQLLNGLIDSVGSARLSEAELESRWQLACQSSVLSDITVFVPSSAKAFLHDIKTADFSSPEEITHCNKTISDMFNSDFTLTSSLISEIIYLAPPTLDDTMPDNERLIRAVKDKTGFSTIYMSNNALTMLPDALRANDFSVKCLMRKSKRYITILDVRAPNDTSPLCGVAIDIGTTTVSAALLDLNTFDVLARATSGNAQIRYGADVINRIIQSTKPGGRERMMSAIRYETINPLINELASSAGIEPNRICRAVIAANTTMNHLFAGVPASSIRLEPYVPVFRELPGVIAQEFDLPIHPEARVSFAPNVGSYVGGDITAGTYVTKIWESENPALFIDLGTNGELVFGCSDYLLTCACSAGPAFEGGDISCGMRATTGAIQACTIDNISMEPTLDIIGSTDTMPIGICGSGIIDTISELFRCGIIDSRGKFCRDGIRVRRGEYFASYILSFSDNSLASRDVELTEIDINNFIRAKAAIYSAINTMLSVMDMTKDDIDRVYIAGGIGSGINLSKAISIGMLPNLPIEKYSYIGNSSLTGACAILLSREAEQQIQELGRSMTYIELSSHPGYMDEFMAACFLPHTDASLFNIT